MSDYRGELYRKIIMDFYRKKHRPPRVKELKVLGIKVVYFRRKYGSYSNYIRNELRLPTMGQQCNARERIVVDAVSSEVVFRGTLYEMNESFFADGITRKAIDHYLNRKIFRGRWYIFSKMNYHVWEASGHDYREYRRVMYFLFRQKCFPNNMLYARRGEMARLKGIGEQLDRGEIQLSDVMDVEKYKEIIGKDIDYYETVRRDKAAYKLR